MARTIWNPSDRAEILSRFGRLRPSAQAQWGKMNASKMVKHCTLPMLSAMGEYDVAEKPTPFKNWPARKLIIYVMPWPKGGPTAPEFMIADDGDFSERMRELESVLARFATRGPAQEFRPHAAFGELSGADWGALTYRHLAHHLRQFGC